MVMVMMRMSSNWFRSSSSCPFIASIVIVAVIPLITVNIGTVIAVLLFYFFQKQVEIRSENVVDDERQK